MPRHPPMTAKDLLNRPAHRPPSEREYNARSKGIGFLYPAMPRISWIDSFADRRSGSPRLIALAPDRPPDSQTRACKSGNNPADLRKWLHREYATEQQGRSTTDW